jgi:hypothetical protein
MIDDQIFPSWTRYAKRYCDAHIDEYGFFNTTGQSNAEELSLYLNKIMIR